MNRKTTPSLALAALSVLATALPALAQTWNGSVNGNWNESGNWTPSGAPGATNTTNSATDVTFSSNPTNTTVTIDANRNIRDLTFDAGAGAYTFNGGPLVLSHLGDLLVNTGVTNTQTFNAPVLLAGNSVFDNDSTTTGVSLNLGTVGTTDSVAATSRTLTLRGTNNGSITGNISQGTNVTLNLTKSEAGTWNVTGNHSLTGTISSGGGTLNLFSSVTGTSGLQSSSTLTFTGASTLGLYANGSTSNSTIAYNNPVSLGNNTVTLNLGSAGGAGATTGNTIALGALNFVATATGTSALSVNGADDYRGSFGVVTLANPAATGATNRLAANTLVTVDSVTRAVSTNFNTTFESNGTSILTITNGITQTAGGGTGIVALTQSGSGLTILGQATGGNNYTGSTTVSGGVLRLNGSSALPSNSPLILRATNTLSGVVELTTASGNFTRSLGTGSGQVDMDNTANGNTLGSGWSAFGGNRFVNLGGASATIVWGGTGRTSNFLARPDNNALPLALSSVYSDSTIDFQNPLDLNGGSRSVNVANGSAVVDAKLSGVLSGATGSELVKTGDGTLELTAANTYAAGTSIRGGTLRAGNSNVLPDTTALFVGHTTGSGTLDMLGNTDTVNSITAGTTAPSNNTGTFAFNLVGTESLTSSRLSATGAVTFNNATVGVSGSGTQGKYTLISAGGNLTGTPSAGSLPAGYRLSTTTGNGGVVELVNQARATSVTAAPASTAIISGGSTSFTINVTNGNFSGGDALNLTATAGSNVTGGPVSITGVTSGGGTSGDLGGFTFNGTTVGAQTGTFSLAASGDSLTNGLQPGSATSGSVNVTVLANSNASFSSPTDANTLNLHVGTFSVGSGPQTAGFSIANLITVAGFTAGLDLDSILLSTADSVALSTDLTTFNNLAAGSSQAFLATLDTSVMGMFAESYTLTLSDQDLPGAVGGQTLTLNLSGNVVPEPATLSLLAVGAVSLLRRRRA